MRGNAKGVYGEWKLLKKREALPHQTHQNTSKNTGTLPKFNLTEIMLMIFPKNKNCASKKSTEMIEIRYKPLI